MSEKVNIKLSIQDLGILFEEIYIELSKKQGSYQAFNDVISGIYRRPTGFIVPLKIHHFMYENYDLFILRAYVQLFQHMLRAEEEIFIPMTFRIQQELGIKKIDIFFSGKLSSDERKRAALISVLSDWIMVGGKKYNSYFQKLFDEENGILDPKGKKIFKDIKHHILRISTKVSGPLLKSMKRYRENIFREYTSKIPILNFVKGPNLEMLFSYWSELLHGNPSMLEQIFNKKIAWRNKNRLYAILWFTGQHTLRRLQSFVDNPELKDRIEKMCNNADNVWQQLTDEWKLEAQQKKL